MRSKGGGWVRGIGCADGLRGEESHKDIRGIIEFLETTSVCACGEGVESDRAEVAVQIHDSNCDLK